MELQTNLFLLEYAIFHVSMNNMISPTEKCSGAVTSWCGFYLPVSKPSGHALQSGMLKDDSF